MAECARAPGLGVAAHGVVAALVAETSQRLENPDQREPLARRLLAVLLEQAFQILRPAPEFGPRLNLALIIEGCLARAQYLADRIARKPQLARNLLDRFAFDKMLTPNPANCLHNQHPRPPACQCNTGSSSGQPVGGSILEADPPVHGVKFARRFTIWEVFEAERAKLAPYAGRFEMISRCARVTLQDLPGALRQQ